MIILTEAQKNIVKGIYNKKELNPIEIKGNLFILPERVLLDSHFPFDILMSFERREVDKSEFIEYDLE